jgi:hypothetical protein
MTAVMHTEAAAARIVASQTSSTSGAAADAEQEHSGHSRHICQSSSPLLASMFSPLNRESSSAAVVVTGSGSDDSSLASKEAKRESSSLRELTTGQPRPSAESETARKLQTKPKTEVKKQATSGPSAATTTRHIGDQQQQRPVLDKIKLPAIAIVKNTPVVLSCDESEYTKLPETDRTLCLFLAAVDLSGSMGADTMVDLGTMRRQRDGTWYPTGERRRMTRFEIQQELLELLAHGENLLPSVEAQRWSALSVVGFAASASALVSPQMERACPRHPKILGEAILEAAVGGGAQLSAPAVAVAAGAGAGFGAGASAAVATGAGTAAAAVDATARGCGYCGTPVSDFVCNLRDGKV